MEPGTIGFPQNPYAETNFPSSNSVQAVGHVWLFSVGWFVLRSRILVLHRARPEKTLHFSPLGTTVRMRWKHTEIQGGCALTTFKSNASFFGNMFTQPFLTELGFFNYIFIVFLIFCLENHKKSLCTIRRE